MNQVIVSMKLSQINRLRHALQDARENARELLSFHDAALGRDTKKNAFTADMYEKEISDCTELIEELCDL